MIKLTVLYGHPTDRAHFEYYYSNTHLPIASKMKGIEKVEYTKFISAPDGTKPAHYRMAEFWFQSAQDLAMTMDSPEGKAAGADMSNFASGGVTLIIGSVEN
jgi:uncharacterized protein (TIGR02118 family)